MKRIFVVTLCLLSIVSCASSATNLKNRKIAEAVHQEGKAYFAQQRYSVALGKFLEAEKIIPTDRFLQYDIGITYMLNEKYNLAETYFKKAIKLEPDFMQAVNALGAVYLKVEKWDKAIKYLNKSADSLLYPTPHYSITNLGWVYLGKKDYELAKDYFLEALKKSPNYLSALHGFATVSLKTNSEQFAIRKLESVLKKFPEVMIINYDLARMYEKLGQNLKAKEFWEKVIRFAPEKSKFVEEAKNRLEKM